MHYTEKEKSDIYREYYGKVLGYIRSKIGHRETAEDLTSEVFVKVLDKLETYEPEKASLSTWIFTIVKNKLIDHYRGMRPSEELPETLADTGSVEEEVCRAEQLELLADALEELPERERDIIILRFYQGKTLKEIAERMGISYAYVKILQNKAFDVIREKLGEE